MIEDDLPEAPYSEEVSGWHEFMQNILHDKEFNESENIEEHLSRQNLFIIVIIPAVRFFS